MISLQQKYKIDLITALQEKLERANMFEVPHLEKVSLNIGLGSGLQDSRFIEVAENTLQRITGQKPVKTKARKSISNFKIRKGMIIGMKVTLRGEKMYSFVEKMIHATLPRIRDFRGLDQKLVDRQGNLTLGLKEHIAFPEIKTDEVEKIHGLEVTFVTTANNRDEGLALFETLGFPFKKT